MYGCNVIYKQFLTGGHDIVLPRHQNGDDWGMFQTTPITVVVACDD